MAAAASNSKQVPPEEWIDFLKKYRYKKHIRSYTEAKTYRSSHIDEFPKNSEERINRTKNNAEYLIIIPNPENIQEFYGIITSNYTNENVFRLTYNPATQILKYMRLRYNPVQTPSLESRNPEVDITIPELIENINLIEQQGGSRSRRRSRKIRSHH